MNTIIYYLPLAYLIGSVPSAVWLGKLFFRTDVREHGSGNAGATNTFRTLGKAPGVIVLLMDIGKGLLAASLPMLGTRLLGLHPPHVKDLTNVALLCGLAAAIGHIYPLFAGFRGGKGVATLFGVLIGIDYKIAGICLLVFLAEFIIFRWVSLGSILAAIAFAVAYIILRHPYTFLDNILVCIYPVLIIITHRTNIIRLIKRTEPRLSLSGRKKSTE